MSGFTENRTPGASERSGSTERVLTWAGVHLNFGSVLLMLLGTQWYILFNVVAGAMAIPADLREAARSFNVVGSLRWWRIYVPAIFPHLDERRLQLPVGFGGRAPWAQT